MTHPLIRSLFDEIERQPLSVSQLTTQIRGTLENRFSSVWIEGEISNFKAHTSGHWYFTIKDEFSQIRATCFRSTNNRIKFRPSDGLQVRVRGRVTVYEPRGEYELCVEALDPVGAGALRVAFEQMKERLAAEGLFDEEIKRRLPILPRRVGVVTSPTGAAIRDILHVIKRRTQTVNVLIAPTRVQGEGASLEIASAIDLLNELHSIALEEGDTNNQIDVIIVGRGGGPAEDLWAFNEEVVARAIRNSSIPVISAIGHETDFTIADFAADMRAPTPSAAAEIVAAREDQIASYIEDQTRNLVKSIKFRLMDERTRVQEAAMSYGFDNVRVKLRDAIEEHKELSQRLERQIKYIVQRAQHRVNNAERRLSPLSLASKTAKARTRFKVLSAALDSAIVARYERSRAELAVRVASLDAMSPLAVLKRGYAIAQKKDGQLIHASNMVKKDEIIQIRLREGSLACRIEEVNEK